MLILATTGSATYAGAVGSAQLVAATLMSIVGGSLGDRLDRRMIILLCDVSRLVLLGASAALIAAGVTHMGLVLGIAVASAVCPGISNPVALAAIKQLVPPSQFTNASAQNQIRFFGATVVGPPIGGFLFGAGRALPFVGAALSFLGSAVLLLLIRKPMQEKAPSTTPVPRGAIEGFRFIGRQPIILYLIVWIMGSNMAFNHTGVFLALIATADERGASSSLIGLTLSIAGAGGIVGALIAGWLIRRVRPSTLILAAAWVGPVAAALLVLSPGVLPLGVIVACVFVRAPITNALFREAVTWQNPAAAANAVERVARGPDLAGAVPGRSHRTRLMTTASYLQRYALKNDSIGFFGPVGWARLTNGPVPLRAVPGDELLRRRTVYFERWAVEAIAGRISGDPAMRPHLRPRLAPGHLLAGREVRTPIGRAVALTVAEAAVLARCDGVLTTAQIAERVAGPDGQALVHDLADRGLVVVELRVPPTPFPEHALREQLCDLPESTGRDEALRTLDALVSARAEVAAAGGDPAVLLAAIERLDTRFTAATGESAKRRPGEMYAGRSLVYEDTVRDVDLELGAPLLAAATGPLELLLTSARWFTWAVARAYTQRFAEVFGRLAARTGGRRVPLARLFSAVTPDLVFSFNRVPPLVSDCAADLQRRWSRILRVPEGRRHEVRSADIRAEVLRAFACPGAPWAGALRHSPGLMIAADGPGAVGTGDFLLVLGELHACANTLEAAPAQPRRAADRRRPRIAEYVASLRHRSLESPAFDPEQMSMRVLFDRSYVGLAPEARRLFRLLGLLPRPDFTTDAAAALTGMPSTDAAHQLRVLAAANLIRERVPGRYTFHDLLRDYARDLALLSDDDNEAALARIYDWYLRGINAAADLLYPEMLRLPADPAAPAGPVTIAFPSRNAARRWLDAEIQSLIACVRHAASVGPPSAAWRIADALRGYFWMGTLVPEWLDVAQRALRAARADNAWAAEVSAGMNIGMAQSYLGNYAVAVRTYTEALDITRQHGWRDGCATALSNLGLTYCLQGRPRESVTNSTDALELHRTNNRPLSVATCLLNLSFAYQTLGRIDDASRALDDSLKIFQERGAVLGHATALQGLGIVAASTGALDRAFDLLTQAREIYGQLNDQYRDAGALVYVAMVHIDAGRYPQALAAASAGLRLTGDMGLLSVHSRALNVLGVIHRRIGRQDIARDHHARALRIARQIGHRAHEAEALLGFAACSGADDGVRHASAALALCRYFGYRVFEGEAWIALAEANLRAREPAPAVKQAGEALAIYRETGHRVLLARALLVFGKATSESEGVDAAAPYWREAYQIFSDIGAPEATTVPLFPLKGGRIAHA